MAGGGSVSKDKNKQMTNLLINRIEEEMYEKKKTTNVWREGG